MSADQIMVKERPLIIDLLNCRNTEVGASHLAILTEEVLEEDEVEGAAITMTEGSVKRRIEEGAEKVEKKVRNTTNKEKHLVQQKTFFCVFRFLAGNGGFRHFET
jgi:hypothetical protein